jgi:hypothetical protein
MASILQSDLQLSPDQAVEIIERDGRIEIEAVPLSGCRS